MASGWATTYDVSYVMHKRYPFDPHPSVVDLGVKIFREMENDGYIERRYTKDNPRPKKNSTQQFRPTDLGRQVAAKVFKGEV